MAEATTQLKADDHLLLVRGPVQVRMASSEIVCIGPTTLTPSPRATAANLQAVPDQDRP